MTSDPFAAFDWSAFNAEMLAYGKRLAKGIAEDIPPLEPVKWWQGPRWENDNSSGYSPEEYGRPRVL